ncbi:unnamed protein product [Caenorhabditis angaria]|uniref:Lethal giant larvae (Lgl)-like C-terminal domain-containing protein n=1 Tax=Caenorhabditis angaria TaxID=860376 RepID=A0A9P1I8H9_9PELO|nr:unnamed protein product [Caenorhabditis angaria]
MGEIDFQPDFLELSNELKAWPISGGLGRECATGHQELVITGHKDGTVRFWQETGEHLQVLYRLKSSSHFERLEEMEVSDKVSHSVKSIEMCLESRQLLVAGVSGQVTLFRFTKIESMNTIAVVNIPLLGNASTSTAGNGGEFEKSPMSNGPGKEMRRQRKIVSRESTNSLDTSDSGDERPRAFSPNWPVLCRGLRTQKVDQITAIALNSCYGVIAIGTTCGLALVDTSQCALIYAWTSSELYGSEPTPAIQLSSMQIGGELTTSPLEEYDEFAEQIIELSDPPPARTISEGGKSAHLLHPQSSLSEFPRPKSASAGSGKGGMMGILRRNTAELAATIRERYQRSETLIADRPDMETPPPSPTLDKNHAPNVGKTGRSHSVKGSIMRRFKTSIKEHHKKEKKEHSSEPATPKSITSFGGENGLERSKSFHSHISEEGWCDRIDVEFAWVRESPISLDAPKRAGEAGNGGNGQQKQRSFDSRRPQLFKTQSVVENGSLQRGETRDSPSLGRQMNSNASPSTSSQSLERSFSNSPQEAITSLCFIHSFSKRNDPKTAPCLWVGTTAGTNRFTSTVVVAPSGTVVKMKGQVLYQCFMDSAFCILSAACENYKERESAQSPERSVINRVSTKASLAPQYSSSIDVNEDVMQILIVVAENEVKVVALPTFSQLFTHKCEDIPLVKAYATHVRGHPVLMCLSAAGQIVCLSLPSLRPLHTSSLLPHSVEFDDPIVQKTAFSDHGLGVYMASPSEMEKYTICQELADQTQDSLGELFGVSSIFGGTPRQDSTDIDVILSEPPKDPKNPSASSSTVGGMRSVARTIPGPSMSMDRAHAGSISAGQAAQMAMQNLNERTEKLNATVDATENLKNSAMNLTSRTGKLVEKYEKKKWYNF